MKKILLFSIFILVISCSDEEKNLSVPDYMKEVFDANLNCSENDFLDLNINDQNLNYEYTTNSGLVLCSFAQGNSGGINCQNCEGHFASLSMPMDSYDSYFQGIPIQPGMEWEIQNEQIPITEINMTGLNVRINVPENLTENILNCFVQGVVYIRKYAKIHKNGVFYQTFVTLRLIFHPKLIQHNFDVKRQ